MTKENLNKNVDNIKTQEADIKSDSLEKRDFQEVVEFFNEAKNRKDYRGRKGGDLYEMTKDIEILIRDWHNDEDNFVERLKKHYPGWERKDFMRLLNELNIDVQIPELIEIKKLEKQEELTELNWRLKYAEDALSKAQEEERYEYISFSNFEGQLEAAKKNKEYAESELNEMGIFKKRFSDNAKTLKKNIREYEESIARLEKSIKKSPLEGRLEEHKKLQKKEATKREVLKKEINEIKNKIKELEE